MEDRELYNYVRKEYGTKTDNMMVIRKGIISFYPKGPEDLMWAEAVRASLEEDGYKVSME